MTYTLRPSLYYLKQYTRKICIDESYHLPIALIVFLFYNYPTDSYHVFLRKAEARQATNGANLKYTTVTYTALKCVCVYVCLFTDLCRVIFG